MVKVLVSDYDKTLYLNDSDIEKNKESIKRFRKDGNIFVIATGRSYLDLKVMIDRYDLEYDFIIINHGATIIGKNGEILYNFTIDNKIIPEIKKDLKIEEYNITYLDCRLLKPKDNVYFCCSDLESRLDFNAFNLTKIAVVYKDDVDINQINENINRKYKDINCYHISKKSLELISKEIDKSKAIKLLADYYRLDETAIYTVGDGYSDISMIRDYNGYAMTNCVPELSEFAIKKIDSVSELIDEIL